MPFKQSKSKPKHSWRFDAIGTAWSIETTEPLSTPLKQSIADHIEQFDKVYSRFRDDSLVSTLAKSPGAYELPHDSAVLSELYRQLYDATNGAMSPLVGASLEAAGYNKHYSLQGGNASAAPLWDKVMTWNGTLLTTTQPVVLDIGAVGKGLLVDEVSELLDQSHIEQYVVDASGDVRAHGGVERIGLENPLDPTMVIGVAELSNASLCASATNRRKWGNDWHHVLDARTGKPVNDVLATWVIAESTMLADGLATALFFVPASALSHAASFDYVRLLASGIVEHSKGFVGELYI